MEAEIENEDGDDAGPEGEEIAPPDEGSESDADPDADADAEADR